MKRKLQALGVLLLLGAIKLPLEDRVTRDLRAQRLLHEPVSASALESLGQSGLAAVLGGGRGLVACILQLYAYTEFKRVNWAEVDSLYSLITRLQPRREGYWDEASWHMAFNAASYYLYRNNDPAYTNEMRGQLREQYVRRGIEILQEGLRWMPESGRLWMQLAEVYNRRSSEHAKAGEAYEKAFRYGAPNYTLHAAGFSYAQALDAESWQKAYAILKGEYDRGRATPGLIEHLKNVERYLNIPREKRIPDAMPVPKVPQKIVGPWK